VNAAQKKAVLQVIAAATPKDSGFKFDGYDKGQANFVVPVGWTLTLEFSSKSSIPHDIAITKSLQIPLAPGHSPAIQRKSRSRDLRRSPTAVGEHGTVSQSFSSDAPGQYYLVRGVLGHVPAGMWDRLTVSASAKEPAVQVTKRPGP
jgi:Sulfocyanin (SoxE) domain